MSPLSLASPASANLQTPGLIATKSYNPGSVSSVAATSSSFVDVDATNLVVSFVAPPSGQILVKLTALAVVASTGNVLDWNLRSGSSDVAGTNATMAYHDIAADVERRATHTCIITGLTPGTTYTYKWGHARRIGSGSVSTQCGGALGPAVMEIWDANPLFSQMAMLAIANVLTPSLIAQSVHNPAVLVDYDGTPASMTDADATNLSITFVTPPSGIIFVKLNAHSYGDSGSTTCWGLREGASDVANSKVVVGGGGGFRSPYTLRISGLVPGSTHTYKWSIGRDYRPGAQLMLLRVGGVFGPAVMEVWDANVTYSQQLTISGVRPFKFVNYQGTALTTSSTTYVDTTIADIVLAAQIGDVIEFGLNLLISSSGGSNLAAVDAVTVAAGAATNATPLNYFTAIAIDGGWRTQNPTSGNMLLLSGSIMYTIVAGDITSGTVTLRTRWKTNTGTLTITADSPNRRAHVWAKNLGQAAA